MVEVFSAIRGRWLGGKISDRRAVDAVEAVAEATLDLAHTTALLPRMWQPRANLSGYDAAHVALAEAHGAVRGPDRYGATVAEVDSDAWLLAGPRGRRLCWWFLDRLLIGPAWRDARFGRPIPAVAEELLAELTTVLGQVLPSDLFGDEPADGLLNGLVHAADWARYWQEPDDVDRALALRAVRVSLLPIARKVAAEAPKWWSEPVDVQSQQIVEFFDPAPAVTSLVGAAEKLSTWRSRTVEDEQQAANRPRDVHAPWSGYWWSAPCMSNLPTTTRSLPGFGAVGLRVVEDAMGWTAASCRPVTPLRQPRVFEIRDAADWIELVARYPLDVSLSRRHDWWRATGADSAWLIPDYEAASGDYDAVHLTARGYLAAAGIALALGSAHTVLAGWNPDQTYWLTDCLTASAASTTWTRGEDEEIPRWSSVNVLGGRTGMRDAQ